MPVFSTVYNANFKLMAIGYWPENPKQTGLLEDQTINY
jgi:hypothetical protein